MSASDRISQKLKLAFNSNKIEVIDESHLHAGHAGARPEGESHFAVTIISEKFTGLSRVARHKLVYDALRDELNSGVHALRMKTLTPEEI